jgi:hypothetical protein
MNPAASPLTSAMNRNQGQTGWGETGNSKEQRSGLDLPLPFEIAKQKAGRANRLL